jgi:hypothetical protein
MNVPRRALITAAILLILTCGARPAQAGSIPFIGNLEALGIEICPQSLCHAAIFAGFLRGQVGENADALGTFLTGIQHTDLPPDPTPELPEPPPALVTGGAFVFRFGLQRIPGDVVPGGLLFNVGGNLFLVLAELVTVDGQRLDATVVLDHNTFPPTVRALVEPSPQ